MKQSIFPHFVAAVLLSGFIASGRDVSLLAQTAPELEAKLQPGKLVYEQHCAACHGSNGNGNGPAAVWLFPKPRNFNSGLFKIQSTPAGSLPTDDDLFQTVTRGMPGSSMPSFTYLSEAQRREAVQYVKWLRPNDYGIPLTAEHWDERTVRNVKMGYQSPPGAISSPVES